MAVLAALLVPVPLSSAGAQSPTGSVLVSNLGRGSVSFRNLILHDFAQAFTTGSNSAGYSLSSVDVHFEGLTDAVWASKLAVTVNAAASGSPGAVLGTLTPSSTGTFSTAQNLRFAAPGGGVDLAAYTTYFVVLDVTAGFGPTRNALRSTSSTAEDAGAAAGWSIADTSLNRTRSSGGAWSGYQQSLKIGVNGVALVPLVSAPSVVFVGEGETVSVRLDLAKEVTGRVEVTASSSDPSRFLVNHPAVLYMGRKYVNVHDRREGVEGHQVQDGYVSGPGRLVRKGTITQVVYSERREPSESISFDFGARDWAGYTDIDEPALHKGYRVVEVTGVATGADGLPANGPDAKFQLLLSSSDASVAFAPITVVVKRSRGLDPVFSPDPRFSFGCRERECLRVDEGGTVQYTVRNSNVPAAGSPLTITPVGEGLSFDPPVVSWTHRDHDEPRTVTVTAAHDGDVRSETRIIRHVFSENWDTSGSLSKILRRSESKAEAESDFNMAVRVVDDDLRSFDAVGADGAVIGQVSVLSRAGESRSGLGRFWLRVGGPPDCTTGYGRSAGLCWDTLRIRLRTGRPDGSWDNAPVAATVHRADQAGAGPSSYTKVAGPRHWFAMHVKPGHWDRLLRVDLTLDPALYGSTGAYDISMSLERDNGEPSAHRQVTVSYGPNLETSPSVDDNAHPVSDGDPVPDDQQAPPHDQDQADQQQAVPDADSGGAGISPALVAEVEAHIASFRARRHQAGVRDWTAVLDRLGGRSGGMSDEDIAAWLARSRRHGWADGVGTLPKVQAALTAQAAAQAQQQQDPPPVVVPSVTVSAGGDVTEGDPATFTVTADAAPAADLAVTVTVAASGDYGVAAGARTVTIPAGATDKVLSVATTGDSVDEADGSVTATVANGDGYDVGTANSATVVVADDDDPPPIAPDTGTADSDTGTTGSYAADPQVVAAVQYLASQTHHGFAHVNRWQRALAAIGALDPADVAGGALTLAEARQNAQRYSSPVWDQVVAEIEAKQAHDT
ncbi:choice-of-anchor R domain-containing protein [Candidatus Poriferisocius sp.]|uniref:choice-of-anchor R domain-containing protein n=1 Tax=Candidatus Poriferisocius sp. TaxID=3101276 RepID=UPI003B01B214